MNITNFTLHTRGIHNIEVFDKNSIIAVLKMNTHVKGNGEGLFPI